VASKPALQLARVALLRLQRWQNVHAAQPFPSLLAINAAHAHVCALH
jgi:hypothetical protein